LAAFITNPTYLSETTATSAQKTRDRTPRTFAGVGGSAWEPAKHSWRAKSGLVPMSP
jgi:hypothetical protein